MEESKRTRRRRKSIGKEKSLVKQSEVQVIEPVKQTGYDRLATIYQNTKVVEGDLFARLYGKWGHMTPAEIELAAQDERLTAFERLTAERLVLALTQAKTKLGVEMGNYIEERYSGKATARVEHSGVNGNPITFASQAQEEKNIELLLEQMSEEELEIYEKMLKFQKHLQKKYES